jgi:hypothetical protein
MSPSPPLRVVGVDPKGLRDWFATWRGQIGYEIRNLHVTVGDGQPLSMCRRSPPQASCSGCAAVSQKHPFFGVKSGVKKYLDFCTLRLTLGRDVMACNSGNFWLGVGKPPRHSSWDWDFLPHSVNQEQHYGERNPHQTHRSPGPIGDRLLGAGHESPLEWSPIRRRTSFNSTWRPATRGRSPMATSPSRCTWTEASRRPSTLNPSA